MSWSAIQAAAQVQAATGTSPLELPHGLAQGSGVAGAGFGQMVSEGLSRLNGEILASQTDMQQVAVGDAQSLHQVMIRLEESRLSFELMLHVRNRVLEAYQDLMKMQV